MKLVLVMIEFLMKHAMPSFAHSTVYTLIILNVLIQVSVLNIRLPKQSTIGDVINELKGKVRVKLQLTFMISCLSWELVAIKISSDARYNYQIRKQNYAYLKYFTIRSTR